MEWIYITLNETLMKLELNMVVVKGGVRKLLHLRRKGNNYITFISEELHQVFL